jgi:Dynein, heavy chain
MLVFIVRSVSFKVFIIVKILPGKEYKTAFPFGMLTKLLGVHTRMPAAAHCMEREAALFKKKSTLF